MKTKKTRPLVKAPKGGRFTSKQIRAALKEVETEYLPTGNTLWLVFDTSNGHKGSYRYAWWFDTKKDALAHIEWQKSFPNAADLSKPFRVVLQGVSNDIRNRMARD
jgi:hypothetical protein